MLTPTPAAALMPVHEQVPLSPVIQQTNSDQTGEKSVEKAPLPASIRLAQQPKEAGVASKDQAVGTHSKSIAQGRDYDQQSKMTTTENASQLQQIAAL